MNLFRIVQGVPPALAFPEDAFSLNIPGLRIGGTIRTGGAGPARIETKGKKIYVPPPSSSPTPSLPPVGSVVDPRASSALTAPPSYAAPQPYAAPKHFTFSGNPADVQPAPPNAGNEGQIYYVTSPDGRVYAMLDGEPIDVYWPREGKDSGGADSASAYARIAEDARQFNEQIQFQRDQETNLLKQREYEAALAREQMMQDWRKQQIAAAQARRQEILNGASQSQNTFSSVLSQLDPTQGDIRFNPNMLPRYMQNVSGYNEADAIAAPNIPALVY